MLRTQGLRFKSKHSHQPSWMQCCARIQYTTTLLILRTMITNCEHIGNPAQFAQMSVIPWCFWLSILGSWPQYIPSIPKWILALWEVDTNHIFKARPLAAFRPAGVQRAMAHEMHACASSTRSCAVGQGCGWRMRWSNKIWVDKNVLRHCEGWNSGQYFRTIRCFKMFKERNFAELHYFGHESDNWQT